MTKITPTSQTRSSSTDGSSTNGSSTDGSSTNFSSTASPFMVQVNQTFNVPAPDAFVVEGFANDTSHPAIPLPNPNYVFRREDLRDVLAFLSTPDGDGLFITGPTGCGKTSLVCQVAARLNWPVQQVTAHGRLELADLIGHHTLVNGNMSFVYGPLALAMKEGHLLVLNELDLAEPAELAGLNDVLEGAPLVISQNGGEIIRPHPKFRLIATGNSAGTGDQTGLYQGVLQQNLAFLDRFRILEADYASADTEAQILSAAAAALPDVFRERMIKVANDVRRLFIGNGDTGTELSITMSTRTLVRWARLTLAFKGAPNAVEYALQRALTGRAEPEQREAIHRIAADVFGDHWDS